MKTLESAKSATRDMRVEFSLIVLASTKALIRVKIARRIVSRRATCSETYSAAAKIGGYSRSIAY